jgi:hypothetical protein
VRSPSHHGCLPGGYGLENLCAPSLRAGPSPRHIPPIQLSRGRATWRPKGD